LGAAAGTTAGAIFCAVGPEVSKSGERETWCKDVGTGREEIDTECNAEAVVLFWSSLTTGMTSRGVSRVSWMGLKTVIGFL
jgi:hypothetical protein